MTHKVNEGAMMSVTAKVIVQAKNVTLDAPGGTSTTLFFNANYGKNDINQEWAKYTPSLNFQMTVKEDVANRFTIGEAYTVTFTPDDANEA